MTHPTPDRLAVLALEEDADAEVLDHVARCRACHAEVEVLQQVMHVRRPRGPETRLAEPHPRVWQRVAQNAHQGRVVPLPTHPAVDVPLAGETDAGHTSTSVLRGRPALWTRTGRGGPSPTSSTRARARRPTTSPWRRRASAGSRPRPVAQRW